MLIHYSAYEDGFRYALSSKLASDWDSGGDLEFLAEEAAADFHSEHDGWEGVWPRTITLYDGKDGAELGQFTVERECEPSFNAQRLAAQVATPPSAAQTNDTKGA